MSSDPHAPTHQAVESVDSMVDELETEIQQQCDRVMTALGTLIEAQNGMRPLLLSGDYREIAIDLSNAIDHSTYHMGRMLGVLSQHGHISSSKAFEWRAHKGVAPVTVDAVPGPTP